MIELTLRDIGILSTLNEASGFPTKHIAKAVEPTAYAATPSVISRNIGVGVRSLERRGLVTKLDDQKPVCWVRTPAGSAALRRSAP